MSDPAKKLCPECGSEMSLAIESYPMGSAFLHERFHVDIFRCRKCGRVELFASEKAKMVTCPVCGATHSPKEKCPICAINTAFSDHAAD